MELEAFRDRLRRKMRQKRITQAELGKRLSKPTHRTTVARWLSGGLAPDLREIFEISRILGVSAAWLIGMSDDERPPVYLTPDEWNCLVAYRALGEENKATFRRIITDLGRTSERSW